ncbi:uncharacterized protein RHO25_011259 [Cercospora beticola]|uniref:Uncharacterized protein n=1 Tax=Cercospora beticola TaxID=122368 RepID=A0ABZ0P4J4_CERBT|nr:hypothetical protein RHO25_011259 [Cercospora beticola]
MRIERNEDGWDGTYLMRKGTAQPPVYMTTGGIQERTSISKQVQSTYFDIASGYIHVPSVQS